MRALRQALGGLLLIGLTTCTVVGGIFLAVSENRSAPLAATETAAATLPPTPLPLATATRTPTSPKPTATASPTTPATPTPSPTVPAIVATATATATLTAPTATLCGPLRGWVAYTVRPGDTLFQLGLATGQTVATLQQANCLAAPAINYGQIIFLPPAAQATATAAPTLTATITPVPAPLRITAVTLVNVVRDLARPNGAVAYVRVTFTGGLAPYKFFDEGIPQLDNPVQALTECGGTLIHTVRVESADGQGASQTYYFSPIACPSP
nr:LysM peptidoglycan-binding domain-containing protein [Chloroflexota bacterium]